MNPEQTRIIHGPAEGERAEGTGWIDVFFYSPEPVETLVERVRAVADVVASVPTDQFTEETLASLVPDWFVRSFPSEGNPFLLDHLREFYHGPVNEKQLGVVSGPHLWRDWVYYSAPEERSWRWWDAKRLNDHVGTIQVMVYGWPTPVFDLEMTLYHCGATEVMADN